MKARFRDVLFSEQHVCPWWLGYTFDNVFRRLVQNPEKILKPYVKPGMTVIDLGCGMGFFTIAMAKLVGDGGEVVALDIQEQMLRILEYRAAKAGVGSRITLFHARENFLLFSEKVDFASSFYMVHETPDAENFFRQVAGILKPGARYLVSEPKGHVGPAKFDGIIAAARRAGLEPVEKPYIPWSRSVVFTLSSK